MHLIMVAAIALIALMRPVLLKHANVLHWRSGPGKPDPISATYAIEPRRACALSQVVQQPQTGHRGISCLVLTWKF